MSVTLPIEISESAASALARRAADCGVTLAGYAAGIIERTTDTPWSLEEISGLVAEDFKNSGMTEEQLGDLLEEAKHEMREEHRRANP